MPIDRRKRFWCAASTRLSARRVQAAGFNSEVLTSHTVSEDRYNSWHGMSDKSSVHNSHVETTL